MNNLNIPLYRAEVKDSKINREDIEIFTELIDGKRYAIGLLCTKGRQIEVTKGDTTTFINIDNSTLAIHFSDMLDSQGNKIFASLNENGKGGDIVKHEQVLGGILKSRKEFKFTSCDDCKNKIDGTYQEICSNCKRFYGCYFEAKEV